jgi:hydroxyacylglutathione hydrolase
MALVFERIQTAGIAVLSYLVGDDSAGVAAVIDPRADVDCYLELARAKQVSITHIFETHIHADLVSGARELCARVESAKIFVSHEGGASYDFAHEPIHDGDTFKLGSVLVTVRHTPGHVAYLIAEKDHPEAPWGVLSGDSLFVSSAGRPDLLGNAQAKKLAVKLFHTLRDFYLALDDGVIVYPGDGAGSPCGADIGDRLSSTIGHERRFNARHFFLGELRERLGKLDRTKPTAVYCDSGYRASIATSILQRAGFDCVCNIPGSWQAWEKAGFPVEGDKDSK